MALKIVYFTRYNLNFKADSKVHFMTSMIIQYLRRSTGKEFLNPKTTTTWGRSLASYLSDSVSLQLTCGR